MTLPPDRVQAILDLEARHDELLELVVELEKRVAGVLAQHQGEGRREREEGRGESANVAEVARLRAA